MTRPRKIMVGFDGSASARRALDAAADLIGYGSTLSVVTVRTASTSGGTSGVARARLHERRLEARYHEAVGEPAEQLVEKAAELDVDLVVVGRRDRNRDAPDALLGSVSSRVAARAPCDVLVTR